MNEWLDARALHLKSVLQHIPNGPSAVVVVIDDDHRLRQAWPEATRLFLISGEKFPQSATAAVFEIQQPRCARFWVLVDPHLKTNLLIGHHLGEIWKFEDEA